MHILDLVHCSHIYRLDIVFEALHDFTQLLDGNLVILDQICNEDSTTLFGKVSTKNLL